MRDKKIKLINKFLDIAFGEGTIGNYFPHAEVAMCGEKKVGNQLECIAKRGQFRIPYLWHNYTVIGQFISENGKYKLGSSLEILPQYKEQAIEYAGLYKAHFKRKTSVKIKEKIE